MTQNTFRPSHCTMRYYPCGERPSDVRLPNTTRDVHTFLLGLGDGTFAPHHNIELYTEIFWVADTCRMVVRCLVNETNKNMLAYVRAWMPVEKQAVVASFIDYNEVLDTAELDDIVLVRQPLKEQDMRTDGLDFVHSVELLSGWKTRVGQSIHDQSIENIFKAWDHQRGIDALFVTR